MAYYRIECDGYLIMDTRLDEYSVTNPSCKLEVNTTGSLEFEIDPSHPHYDKIHKISSVIRLISDDRIVFQGRVMDDDISFDNVKKIECEGELSYLLDSIVRPYTYDGSVEGLVQTYIDSHNSQVEEKKQFNLGVVTVEDPNNYIHRAASAYPTTFDEFKEKCIENLGGYMRLRYMQDGTYFDYIEDYGNVNQQVIEFGKNLLDMSKFVKGADVATRIIPLGAVIEEEAGEQGTEKHVTIASVNDGLDYVEDPDAVELYGIITKVTTHDGITLPSNLITAGYADLAAQRLLEVTLEINALDLSVLDVNVEQIKLGDWIRVKSKPHNVDEYMLVSQIEMDLVDPSNNVITLGSTKTVLTNEISGMGGLKSEVEAIKSDYVTSANLEVAVVEASSAIDRSASEIILSVSSEYATKTDLDSLNEELDSRITQTDEDLQITFERTTMYTQQVEEESRSNYEHIQTVYRVTEDGAEIGKSDSPFKAKIDNEELGFYENAQKVAYIGNKKMYITDAEINNKLTIGNYDNGYWDFLPRQNGNLSLKWRGGAE